MVSGVAPSRLKAKEQDGIACVYRMLLSPRQRQLNLQLQQTCGPVKLVEKGEICSPQAMLSLFGGLKG